MALNSLLMKGVVKRFLKEHPEYTAARLEAAYRENPPVHGVRTGDGLVIIESSQNYIIPQKDLIWAYIKHNEISVNLIPMGNPTHVEVWTRQGEKIIIATWTRQKAQELLTYLYPRLPGTVFGHSQRRVRIWNSGVKTGHPEFDILAAAQHQDHE